MTNNLWKIAGASLAALAFATACGGETPAPVEPAPVAETPAPPPGPDYASFVASTARTAEDTAKDANRKPAEVLAFTKVGPGQTVFEMEAGAGFDTELLSQAVGPTGKVIMQAPKEFEGYYKDPLAARLKDKDGYSDVRVMSMQNDAPVEIRRANGLTLPRYVEDANRDGKRVIIVTNLQSPRSIQQQVENDIKGTDYVFNTKGLVQHPNYARWVEAMAETASSGH